MAQISHDHTRRWHYETSHGSTKVGRFQRLYVHIAPFSIRGAYMFERHYTTRTLLDIEHSSAARRLCLEYLGAAKPASSVLELD